MIYSRNDNTKISSTTIIEDPTNATIFIRFKGEEYKILTIATNTEDESDMVIYLELNEAQRYFVRLAICFF